MRAGMLIALSIVAGTLACAFIGHNFYALSFPASVFIGSASMLPLVVLACYQLGSTRKLFRETVADIDRMMVGSAEMAFFMDSVRKKIEAEAQSTRTIAGQSDGIAQSIQQLASNAGSALKAAADVRLETRAGGAETQRSLEQIDAAHREADAASALMRVLRDKAQQIHAVTDLIDGIADRTNLLALNASIEAARAGKAGAGFAVVANEVRMLAQRTSKATEDIGAMLNALSAEAENASGEIQSLAEQVLGLTQTARVMQDVFGRIENLALASETEVGQIAGKSREHVESMASMAASTTTILDSMAANVQQLPAASESVLKLSELAEQMFFKASLLGAHSHHDEIRLTAQKAAESVGKLFEAAIKDGKITQEALFDREYALIPDTDPPKHTTRFDAFTDQVLPVLQDGLLESMPHLIYAGAVDNNGYFPTHNRRFSKPLTGNYKVDLMNNRTKRIFRDRTGSRCGANTQAFLLQTYKRDTGEVMHDLSAPIYVNGKHWGGFRIGYPSAISAKSPQNPVIAEEAKAPA